MISWDASLALIRLREHIAPLGSSLYCADEFGVLSKLGEDKWGKNKATQMCAVSVCQRKGHHLGHLTR